MLGTILFSVLEIGDLGVKAITWGRLCIENFENGRTEEIPKS